MARGQRSHGSFFFNPQVKMATTQISGFWDVSCTIINRSPQFFRLCSSEVMDGRRHSVDVPISRTLVALRRVRSLRDPSTHSMSKLSPLIDSLDWEMNPDNYGLGSRELYYGSRQNQSEIIRETNTTMEKMLADHNDDSSSCDERDEFSKQNEKRVSEIVRETNMRMKKMLADRDNRSSCDEQDEVSKQNEKRVSQIVRETNMKMKKMLADRDNRSSCDERDEFSKQNEKIEDNFGGSKHSKLGKSYKSTNGDALSRLGSPCSYSIGEKIGFTGSCHQGCGIRSCWSRTKRYRESNLVSYDNDVLEEQPLLLTGESPYIESPTNLCQKYMPKSFSDLVGQSFVATSLLNSISNKQISSLYIFHGPRGTGKTSASRLFAASLNCHSRNIISNEPCSSCHECSLLFSGRSRDFQELDPLRINKIGRRKSNVLSMWAPPVSSSFKVYVLDECHLLRGETWADLLSWLDGLPRNNVILVMLTPNLDKVPCSVVSRSRVHRFQRVKEADIVGHLRKICVEEGIEFEEDALSFVANKSGGSVRDSVMMLDQLSLLGKKITVSLVCEVLCLLTQNGVVSNDELLDLLYLALSSDASRTVKRARELMRSRTEPLQLVSQLANLIMDILAGKFPDSASSDVTRKLFGMDNSEADMHQLSHALKILSQTEKQLRTSKNQTTWLTVALLQLSSSHNDSTDSRLSMRTLNPPEGEFHSTSSTWESLKCSVACACDEDESEKNRTNDDKETFELIWSRAVDICTPRSFRKFLRKRGNLVDIRLVHGTTVAELEFNHPDYVSKAEKSWKVIASALQLVLGYNVELRINLANNETNKHSTKSKGPYFGLFNCSRKVHLKNKKSPSSEECKSSSNNNNNTSENSDPTNTNLTRDKYVETCSSEYESRAANPCCHGKELFKTIRGKDGNALSIGMISTPRKVCLNSVRTEPKSKNGYVFSPLSCTLIEKTSKQ
ncbi:replication factor C / DNA polymerase IIIgamma-tau subunit [Striga asiatica]|uniref:Replication factor C / DNA polymerase IIIgamma-tau subunit n=1 Tax=Striga asiatica TaxID=4170 RepID=A0A5A7Q003_STRAF|nr:replication factor C / DNA polymerase IIIgamma-tau subunit [Striga asiatica]